MSRARRFMKRRHDKKIERRKESQLRLAEWQELTLSEQLSVLDNRLGKGLGAVKQRARIAAKMNAGPTVTANAQNNVAETAEGQEPKRKLKAKERRAKEKNKQ